MTIAQSHCLLCFDLFWQCCGLHCATSFDYIRKKNEDFHAAVVRELWQFEGGKKERNPTIMFTRPMFGMSLFKQSFQ